MAHEDNIDRVRKLLRAVDRKDPFMTGGHEVKKIRGRVRKYSPDWVFSNDGMQKVLLAVFPDLHTNTRQRRSALQWSRFVHLFFRVNMPERHVAAEMGITVYNVRAMARRVRRAGEGMWTNGKGQRGAKPRGRPKRQLIENKGEIIGV